MGDPEIRVSFRPSGRSVGVQPGSSIFEAATRAGLALQNPCGGNGKCGKCRVLVRDASAPAASEEKILGEEDVKLGFRLACQYRVTRTTEVEIPPGSMFERGHRILDCDGGVETELCPAVRKKYFELPIPQRGDDMSDASRLRKAVGHAFAGHGVMRELPGFLRRGGWKGTAVLRGDELLAVETGDTSARTLGVAIDIGTTTLVATLMDLVSGKELSVASALNPQIAFGDDVISRIQRVREDLASLKDMQSLLVSALNGMIEKLTRQESLSAYSIYEITAAGNTAMQHILCGFDCSSLGELPFSPVFDEPLDLPASQLGFAANPVCRVHVFGQIGGFVGGDTVAGILSSRLDRREGPVLFIDIGTNGEVVLAHNGAFLAASTAAGPAFEGARISQGMHGAAGAIEKVGFSRSRLDVGVIGGGQPSGICGSGLIDAAAVMLRHGAMDYTGRILSPAEAAGMLKPAIAKRLFLASGGQPEFELAAAGESARGEPIRLRQRDIRELQLSSGAIRAGISTLLRDAGLKAEDLRAVLLAGGFGNFVRRENALRIGLLPPLPLEKIHFIGNSSSLGAKLVLLSTRERLYAEELRKMTRHVDLSMSPDFQSAFAEAMTFPEGESSA